jgi:hypothetical protein
VARTEFTEYSDARDGATRAAGGSLVRRREGKVFPGFAPGKKGWEIWKGNQGKSE